MRFASSLTICGASCALFFGYFGPSHAQCALPNQLTNGQTADATQVMANFAAVVNCLQAVPTVAGSANAIQLNAGAAGLGAVGPLTDGQLVIGSTGNAPQASTLNAGAGINITNAPGAVTITATGGGGGGGGGQFSWLRLVLFNNSGGNAFSWTKTVITDANGNIPTFVNARSSQVYQATVPSNTFADPPIAWSSVDLTTNFFDVQFSSAFVPGKLAITARPDNLYTDGPIDLLVLGSNDGVVFFSLGGLHFSSWTSASQVQTVNLP